MKSCSTCHNAEDGLHTGVCNDCYVYGSWKEKQSPSDITDTLAERGSRYGIFTEHARVTQNIKAAMRDSRNWNELSDSKKECLEMIAHKVGRILNGDSNYHDSWHDIVGYTKLVADELQGIIK